MDGGYSCAFIAMKWIWVLDYKEKKGWLPVPENLYLIFERPIYLAQAFFIKGPLCKLDKRWLIRNTYQNFPQTLFNRKTWEEEEKKKRKLTEDICSNFDNILNQNKAQLI